MNTLTTFCRKINKFDCKSLEQLVEKCKELENFYLTKVNPPNYDLAS